MDDLDFNDETHTPKHSRTGYGSTVKPEQKRIRKQNKFREIEQLLEERRLQKELQELYQPGN